MVQARAIDRATPKQARRTTFPPTPTTQASGNRRARQLQRQEIHAAAMFTRIRTETCIAVTVMRGSSTRRAAGRMRPPRHTERTRRRRRATAPTSRRCKQLRTVSAMPRGSAATQMTAGRSVTGAMAGTAARWAVAAASAPRSRTTTTAFSMRNSKSPETGTFAAVLSLQVLVPRQRSAGVLTVLLRSSRHAERNVSPLPTASAQGPAIARRAQPCAAPTRRDNVGRQFASPPAIRQPGRPAPSTPAPGSS